MSIKKEFSQFTNEEDFRNRFIVPLLHRLGFSVVMGTHGPREFGKDIVFGEINRFGHFVYSAIQAKFVDSISKNEAHDLVQAAEEGFKIEFELPQVSGTHQISRFYVMNAGSISEPARKNFFSLVPTPMAANSVLLDGDDLLERYRWASLNRGEMVKESFVGVLFEVTYNDAVAETLLHEILQALEITTYPMVRFRLAAVSAFLARPVTTDDDLIASIEKYFDFASGVNRLVDSVMNLTYRSQNQLTGRMKSAQTSIADLQHEAKFITVTINKHLAALGKI